MLFLSFVNCYYFIFFLQVIGAGSVAQSVLSNETAGTFLSVNWGYGMAVAMGVWVSVGVSGEWPTYISLTFQNIFFKMIPWLTGYLF